MVQLQAAANQALRASVALAFLALASAGSLRTKHHEQFSTAAAATAAFVANEVAVGIVCKDPVPIPEVTQTWLSNVSNMVVAHETSHCEERFPKKRCKEYRELYVMQELVERFPKAKFFFLADERSFLNWDAIRVIAHSFDPSVRAFVGYNQMGDGCKIKDGIVHGFKGTLMLTRAAALNFAKTIPAVASKFEFHLLSGCKRTHLGYFGGDRKHFFEKCDLDAVASSYSSCAVTPDEPSCFGDKLVRDFDGAHVFYSGTFDAIKDNPRHLIAYWGQHEHIKRLAWYCEAYDTTLFPNGAFRKTGYGGDDVPTVRRGGEWREVAKAVLFGHTLVSEWPVSPATMLTLDCLLHYKSRGHMRATDGEIMTCCAPKDSIERESCAMQQRHRAKLEKLPPTPAPTMLEHFIMHDTNHVTCDDSEKATEDSCIKVFIHTENFENRALVVGDGPSGPAILKKAGFIQGITRGILGMCPGQTRRVLIPRDLAWGNSPPSSSAEGPVVSNLKMLEVSDRPESECHK